MGTGRGRRGDLVHTRLRDLHGAGHVQAHEALALGIRVGVEGSAHQVQVDDGGHPCGSDHRDSKWGAVGDLQGGDADCGFQVVEGRTKIRGREGVDS